MFCPGSRPTVRANPYFLGFKDGESITILDHAVVVSLEPWRVLAFKGKYGF
jgi:hypothetical protein